MRGMPFLAALTFSLLLSSINRAEAGLIGLNEFGPNSRLVDFNGLGLPSNLSAPLFIDGDRYTTDDNDMRYNLSFGTFLGTTGEGLGNDTDFGFIDIELAIPALRAGAVFGQGFGPWSVTVEFFDESNSLLGTTSIGNASLRGEFVGWEADAGLISRIRATDTSNGSVLLMDNLITEVSAVPEPSSVFLFGSALLACTCIRRRRNQTA